jgi:hypothetical protein
VRSIAVVLLTAVLAAAPASAAQPGVSAKLTASAKAPAADEAWRWTVTVRNAAGDPMRAKLRLQVLLGGVVVGCFKAGAMAPCSGAAAGDLVPFTGRRTGVIRWPAQSRGVELTFQAIVVAASKTMRLRVPVKVA